MERWSCGGSRGAILNTDEYQPVREAVKCGQARPGQARLGQAPPGIPRDQADDPELLLSLRGAPRDRRAGLARQMALRRPTVTTGPPGLVCEPHQRAKSRHFFLVCLFPKSACPIVLVMSPNSYSSLPVKPATAAFVRSPNW